MTIRSPVASVFQDFVCNYGMPGEPGSHGAVPAVGPPRWDPAYQPLGEVMVRDLARYAAVAENGGGA